MKHKIVIALKMLRYRADAEDRSFLCVVMRQLTSSVLSHHKDTEELIVALLDKLRKKHVRIMVLTQSLADIVSDLMILNPLVISVGMYSS